eukprot:scaffold1272_cov250-Pinguiococcus_pyrenoidosus.AAC.73
MSAERGCPKASENPAPTLSGGASLDLIVEVGLAPSEESGLPRLDDRLVLSLRKPFVTTADCVLANAGPVGSRWDAYASGHGELRGPSRRAPDAYLSEELPLQRHEAAGYHNSQGGESAGDRGAKAAICAGGRSQPDPRLDHDCVYGLHPQPGAESASAAPPNAAAGAFWERRRGGGGRGEAGELRRRAGCGAFGRAERRLHERAATSEELALTSLVGHVKIRWRNDMGEEGIVASSDITEEHHEQRVVAVQAELPGRWAVHQPFQGKIRVTNNLNRALELQLQLRKAHADGLLALGKSFRNIGTVSPGQTVETTMDFMPVSLGLRRVEGIVLVDMVTAMEYPQGTLGTVLICARPEQPEDGASPP